MEADAINKKYWSTVEPENIMAGLCLPGEELTTLLPTGLTVLDVGCGTGKVSEYLNGMGYVVTGIDINKKALEENRELHSGVKYIEADITERLPFENETFDAIVVPYVFVSIIDKTKQEAAAVELTRMLKTQGLLWVCEATRSEDYNDRYIVGKEATGLDNVALSFTKNELINKSVERVIRHYSVQEIDDLFQSFKKLFNRQTAVASPSSGMTVQTLISVYRKL